MFIRTTIFKTGSAHTSKLLQAWSLKPLSYSWKMFNRSYTTPGGDPGSGAGKGGGGGGSIRDAGGGLGRFGAAQEEGYFYNKDKEKLSKLKKQLKQSGKLHQKDENNEK